ncbi:peptidoglycan-binding protein [Streptosporangium sp. NPDC004379]|uniref:peptidoglycan-binding protein n=1 Tax=Streptosporangium sp. NPDC004379 TaxID=3366189 RepID=UPI0036CED425
MRNRRRVLGGILAGVVLVAGAGWAVGTRLRSPADEAALRRPPKASLVTSPVARKKLTSAIAVSGTLAYGSPLPVTLAGVVGGAGGTDAAGAAAGGGLQRVTRAPRPGKIKEGSVLLEVNGRPVFALRGKVPMHRTMAPGTGGADVRQLQAALRRLGYRAPSTGVFDSATAAVVRRWYAARGYRAQEPDLAARRELETLRQAVRTAEEDLLTDTAALDTGRDVKPLTVKLDNAREDLRAARNALAEERARDISPEEATRLTELTGAVRQAEEAVLAAGQALAAAKPEEDKTLLEAKASNARENLRAAQDALAAFDDEARAGKATRLAGLTKEVRVAEDAVATAGQALREARRLSPLRLKVANGRRDVAGAKALLAEYLKSYGVSVPPGEIVFLSTLPARLGKAAVRPGDAVEGKVATVTSSSFAVTGSVDRDEAKLLRKGLKATLETADGAAFPAVLTATGKDAEPSDTGADGGDAGEKKKATSPFGDATGSVPVLLTPTRTEGLREAVGTPVTARISVGATGGAVLAVPVAAVVTSADGRARVRVALPGGGDRVSDVEVRTGLAADGDVEVTPVRPGTLKEGDRVVVSDA